MNSLTTYEKNHYFSIAMSDYKGTSFDNKDALGERFSIVLIEKGNGIATIDGKYISYIAPCVFCVNEKEHFIIPDSNENCIRAVFFHPCVINSFLDFDNISDSSPDAPVTINQDKSLVKCILQRDDRYVGKFNIGASTEKRAALILDGIHKMITDQSMANWPCRSRSYIMELLFLLDNLYVLDNSFEETYLECIDEEFYPILVYVYHNYEIKITVQDITDKFYVSRATLAKMFQKNVGESFLSYLNKLRINLASTLLRDTMLPINEIMQRVGFTDNVHFLRTFKKYTGLSPSAYRERNCWM